ncbi:PREDICTED: protein misato [Acromyrmex echinatior]|uniref:Protein misato n=1 Tax=Acromyrmex echinatior TaxID=103372 RepID=F4W528_ACREC|nr:PREDICTED: protein misato [Acromyrmex echinatior]EGI70724.1 Protein misato [Acromyrmex echinatior]
MTTREILTIQLGHYSNFIGTHWWNLQESNFTYDPKNPSEINHDVLYKEGENMRKQITFTPRLLIADLKGAIGYLSEQGSLYDTESDNQLLWDSTKLEITNAEPSPRTPFIQNLNELDGAVDSENFNFESDVKSWVDYLSPQFHPRTVTVIKQYLHNCTQRPFNIFTYGRDLWSTEQFFDNFTDKIRLYIEECDLMQGFQVLMDSVDGFAGLGASCVQHLRDEYGKSILAFPCLDFNNAEPSASDLVKVVNTALCWQHIGENSSLYSPLSCGQVDWPFGADSRKFENITYSPELKYHSSAILATALDTLSLRYRTKKYPSASLSDLCADLNKLGRKAAATSLSLPFPMKMKMDLIDVLDEFEGSLWTSLTPSCDIPMDNNMQSIALRGISEDRIKRPIHEASKQISKPAYRCSSVHEMMTLYLACTCHASATYLSNIEAPLKITLPYPKIFNNNVTKDGNIASWPVGTDVNSIAVMAGMHSGSNVAAMYESLLKQTKRIRSIKKFHAFTDSGLEEDEFVECVHNLTDCKEAYEDYYI